MRKQIRLNAFDMNCVGHIQHGMWTHPRDESSHYNTLEYWQNLAIVAERGKFDGIFLADIVGVYDVYKDSPDPSILNSVQIPVNDPLLVVPVMAAVTKHIGFGVTSNLTYEAPYLFARRASTLDHLTRGRLGWNIVTGYLDSAARGMGLAAQPDHDTRYDIADEYMEVVYKLWEGSWEDGAVLRDKANRVFADPAKIHRVQHVGRHYRVDAIHLSEPSPQRTPVLYQAGASTRGREFAATHAECVFINAPDKAIARNLVNDIRARAVAHGRQPEDIAVFLSRTAVVGRTRKEAEEKYQKYHRHASVEGALAHFSSSTGLDLSRYQLDEPIRYEKNNASNSTVEAITTLSATPWTPRRIIEQMGLGSRIPAIVGSADEVADALIAWVEETGIDGFNLSRIVTPESLEDFVDLVVPILQERGAYKRDYAPGTLREKLFGRARLPQTHPAAAQRRVTALPRNRKDAPVTSPSAPTLRERLADLHAQRVATWDPAALQVNIDQRATLVQQARHTRFVREGDRVAPFRVPEVDGAWLQSDDLLAAGPVVLVFFRFAGCPACNIALPYYRDHLAPLLHEHGATLLALSPQVPERLVEIKRRHELSFPVASDIDNDIARSFNILYSFDNASRRRSLENGRPIGEVTGTGTWELPLPAVVVIDHDHIVRFADVSPDWLVRTEAETVLAALRWIDTETMRVPA